MAALSDVSNLSTRRVLILGAGMLGLCGIAMARTAGAAKVVAADICSDRVKRARAFGATDIVCLDTAGLADLRSVIGGDGADLVLEMSGAAPAVECAPELCAIGGIVKLVGSALPISTPAWIPEQIVRKLIRIQGVHNYSPEHFQAAMQFVAEQSTSLPFSSLIERTYCLQDVQDAFQYAATGSATRVAVTSAS